jgi:hypothetical protein
MLQFPITDYLDKNGIFISVLEAFKRRDICGQKTVAREGGFSEVSGIIIY